MSAPTPEGLGAPAAPGAHLGGLGYADTGRPCPKEVGDAALQRTRALLDRRGSVSGAAWRAISPQLREVLLSLCTDRRNVDADSLMAWGQLTPDERAAIGATARTWRRELQGAAWLR